MRAASTQPPWQISRGTDTFLCSFDVRSTKTCHKCLQKPPEGFFKGKNRKRKQQQQQAAEEAAEGDEEAEDEEAEEAAEEAAGGGKPLLVWFWRASKEGQQEGPLQLPQQAAAVATQQSGASHGSSTNK
jgi:hypothetical protein